MKKYISIIIAIVTIVVIAIYGNKVRLENQAANWQKLQGSVFHTFYHITYQDPNDYSHQIDSLFAVFDGSLSMFNDTSIISRMNRNEAVRANLYFKTMFKKAKYVTEKTNGAFDITVAPLVNLWGFGFKNSENVTPEAVDSILKFVGCQLVSLDEDGILHKQDTRTILDASSIAKGYMSDIVGEYLQQNGVKNYMVEIGGEICVNGHNSKGKPWTIGISRPINDNEQQLDYGFQAYLAVEKGGLATSGNYRNFYEKDGRRIAHTIDPKTGYPVQRDVLSATVIAPDCMTADAFATAFMVMGKDKAMELMATEPNIEGYLITPSPTDSTKLEVVYSAGFDKYLKK